MIDFIPVTQTTLAIFLLSPSSPKLKSSRASTRELLVWWWSISYPVLLRRSPMMRSNSFRLSSSVLKIPVPVPAKQMDKFYKISLYLFTCPYSALNCSLFMFNISITSKNYKFIYLHDFSSLFLLFPFPLSSLFPFPFHFGFSFYFAYLLLGTTIIQISYK